MARFAVPFFFVISGYFWGIKVRNGEHPVYSALKTSKRIFIVFLSWCVIYLLPYNIAEFYNYGLLGPAKYSYWNVLKQTQYPLTIFMEGTKPHLWFLISLIISLYLSALFIHKKLIKSLIFLSILIYTVGVLAKAYSLTPIGITIHFNTRNGPFFGLLPFVVGYVMSGFTTSKKWFIYGLLIFFFGSIIHFSEIYILWKYFHTNPIHDFVFGTAFMGGGSNSFVIESPSFAK